MSREPRLVGVRGREAHIENLRRRRQQGALEHRPHILRPARAALRRGALAQADRAGGRADDAVGVRANGGEELGTDSRARGVRAGAGHVVGGGAGARCRGGSADRNCSGSLGPVGEVVAARLEGVVGDDEGSVVSGRGSSDKSNCEGQDSGDGEVERELHVSLLTISLSVSGISLNELPSALT